MSLRKLACFGTTLGPRAACVNEFIGLSYSFTANSTKARVLRWFISGVLRFLINRDGSVAVVQNGDDLAALIALGIPKSRNALFNLLTSATIGPVAPVARTAKAMRAMAARILASVTARIELADIK